jgi:hypothetical protein
MVTQALVGVPRTRQIRPAGEAVDWLKPSPLWKLAAADYRQAEFFQPAILEFASDDFITEFLAMAQDEAGDAISAALAQPVEAGQTLKLFQPLHGRFYLVCASLACRVPGFPSHVVDQNKGESVFFVLRRLIDGREYAWVGPEGKRTWQSTDATPRRVLDGEERMPVSPAPMASGRSLLFGYLPVSSGETYKVPAAQLVEGNEAPPDVRVEEFGSRFSGPLTGPTDDPTELPDFTRSAIHQTRDEQSRLSSVYLLLEGWEYFLEHMPDVAAVIKGDASAALVEPRIPQKQALLDHIEGMSLAPSLNLLQALRAAAQQRETLNQDGGVQPDELDGLGFTSTYDLKHHPVPSAAMLAVFPKLRAALPGEPPAIALPKLTPRSDADYVVRMVYERAECDPIRRTISLPSRVFRLAPFFDPEAPARQIKIALPADVSVAGLRKFKPGVTFMLSESMQRKMQSLTGKERALIQDENASLDEGPGIAWICSFSIQIIFIVAFMLMIMFVFILNIVFWWIVFFRICLPIPKSLLPK